PIWECAHCGHFDVIGSREELQARAVAGWEAFAGHTPHRPYIDAVKVRCSACGAATDRIKDVGNPWLDAGIVSFSTLSYGDDMERWRKWFPADFITESFPGQFRNWFYSLLTMAAALENKPATKTVLGFATLLAEDGRPMHKSWGNYIEFNEAADSIGADVMRWMYCQQRYDADLLFGYHHADETRRQFLLPLWNVYTFFVTYARLDGWTPAAGRAPAVARRPELDRWILARLQQVVAEVTAALEDYHIYKATGPVEVFLDDLSNWYVRRSRRRFWKSGSDADKQAAYSTLYHFQVTLGQLLAPFVPFVAEQIYQNLVRSVEVAAPESVHHCAWPAVDPALRDEILLAEMEAARTVVALGHAVRAAGNLKVRQPLSRVVVVAPPAQRPRLQHMAALVADELNVKALEFVENEAELVTYRLMPDNRALGPRFGPRFPKVRAALAEANPQAAVTILRSGQQLALDVDGELVELAAGDVIVTPQPKAGFAVKAEGEYVVALDTAVTPALRAEGLAREFVRRVQDLRKSAGFEIADRINTYFIASPALAEAVLAHADYVQGETLTVELKAGGGPAPRSPLASQGDEPGAAPGPGGAATAEDTFDGERVSVTVVKVETPKGRGTKRAKPKAKAAPKKAKAKPAAKPKPAGKAQTSSAKPKPKAKAAPKKAKAKPAAKPKPAGKAQASKAKPKAKAKPKPAVRRKPRARQ
ncbi:MAG: class I tRNA ligase family protein, partial [Anaerolineales bacterium]|nr:class I tRNA ligase family protein [Anaerolineales bacterium]